MSYRDILKENNDSVSERYALVIERIREIPKEHTAAEAFQDYFKKTAQFILLVDEVAGYVDNDAYAGFPVDKLQNYNQKLYEDVIPENYDTSYANPAYAAVQFGKEMGQLLSFLYTELRGMIPYAHEGRKFDMTICMELFLEVYNAFEDEELPTAKSIKEMIYWFVSDYCDVTLEDMICTVYNPEMDFITDIVMHADFSNDAYLYQYGEYIGELELAAAHYLNHEKSQKDIDAMAKTMVEGYIRGFNTLGIDRSSKKTVNLRFNIGFERMMRSVILQFEGYGLKPVIWRSGMNAVSRKGGKTGVVSTGPNHQYDFDHRFDQALFLDKAYVQRRLSVLQIACEKYKTQMDAYAGPALVEIFGEQPFEPIQKDEAFALDEKQQELRIQLMTQESLLYKKYIDFASVSFTIIAYPLPGTAQLKAQYNEIFDGIVRINTLNNAAYQAVQQKIIQTLDACDYVHVLGNNGNKTDLKVALCDLEDVSKQTRFENCTADVNIPLGEVFTSPKLQGTDGILHVTKVYLNGLLFKNLEIHFKDGMITDYNCDNFDSDEKNKKYIKDNILMNHPTLPMGEFAIGTNTTAYVFAEKYEINQLMPILIAEKMGPHFAVGDTCYSNSEDRAVFNPDGREIIARENDFSLKRHEHPEEAYFNCHTDITIPYNELGHLSAVGVNGQDVDIIRNGRFVLEGCEMLNEAFEAISLTYN